MSYYFIGHNISYVSILFRTSDLRCLIAAVECLDPPASVKSLGPWLGVSDAGSLPKILRGSNRVAMVLEWVVYKPWHKAFILASVLEVVTYGSYHFSCRLQL